ncbi:TIGR04283 family arsenosugar biosynthesis glycosyltransferase [Synechocystis sp. PCC 7509]|uniref:TIGR04283 family arsenosugar biosynthesis glycosyltransferase n=1 Tax=Synechocystis sp. PCC 7509 TaxID=927677 RepID=UPI0002ACC366|nr:TIGR04283 family arsenosugar biosynthesis glycosyltransferase [Synechocystis sp. PCC 7509]
MTHPTRISVIIPVLNEAENIADTLASTKNAEVIVVDGGSQDNTVQIAQALGVKVLLSNCANRAQQMNLGAQVATGEILLFLHADTRLPRQFDTMVHQAIARKIAAGAFALRIDSSLRRLRLVEIAVNVRSRIFALPYGDQAIFLDAKLFHKLGGFANLPIMEDFELICRLRRRGQIAIISTPVVTSKRRWQKLGIIQTIFINQVAIIAYLTGISPNKIATWYQR